MDQHSLSRTDRTRLDELTTQLKRLTEQLTRLNDTLEQAAGDQ